MSHEIETIAYANEVPWHGLGVPVSDDISVDELLVKAGLDWTVSTHPLEAIYNGTPIRIGDRVALVRDKDQQVLTIASPQWRPVQNRDVLGFFRKYVAAGGAKLETAGSLRKGRVVWGLANIGRSFEVGRGDKVQGYLLLSSPHECGRAITARLTTIRVVCANTLAAATEKDAATYSQNHLRDFDVQAAQAAVEQACDHLGEVERRAKVIAGLKISVEDVVQKVYAPVLYSGDDEALEKCRAAKVEDRPARIRKLIDSLLHAPGAEPGTGWGALNGFTHWADHASGSTAELRLSKAWFGSLEPAKRKVEKTLLELAS